MTEHDASDSSNDDNDDVAALDKSADATHETKAAPEPSIRPLRMWPAVLLLVILWGFRSVPTLEGEMSMRAMMLGFFAPLVCAAVILLWWLLLSRAWIVERLLGFVGLCAIMVATTAIADKTIRGFGTMLYAIPSGVTAFCIILFVFSQAAPRKRTSLALLAALIAFGFWDLVRTDEIRGDFQTARSWRWESSAEDRFLAELSTRGESPTATDRSEPLAEPEWPAFRGPNRDSVARAVALGTDWAASPPVEQWRIKVGPGWSSFSVAGRRLFTQEQRGDNEAVVCYDANSGATLWVHEYKSRFWEVVGGAGPRGTPTISDGNLYTLGANGILHRLDPITGAQVWRTDISEDADRKPPQWGYVSSPLIANGFVIVHGGGKEDKGILAYDIEEGKLAWSAAAGIDTYSSPHLANIDGKQCVLMLTNDGLTIVDPADGSSLGEHAWKFQGYRVVQPLVLDDTTVLLGTAMGTGTQRVQLSWDGGKFAVSEQWRSRGMSPYYNDFVVHKGHIYGFDNNIFACVELSSGERKWKRGRYGNGQVLLLPEGDQLLITSEDGELVLLQATPEKLVELAKHRVLDGRTWNHPVLIGDRIYVRNAEEAACFTLPLAAATGVQSAAE